MNTVIDNLNSVTDWIASGGSTSIHGLNDHPEFIAGDLDASLMFSFNGQDSYVEKTYTEAIDVSDYTYMVVHVYSLNLGSKHYQKEGDFSYKIDLGDSTKEFYLPAFPEFTHCLIGLSDVASIERIRITALTGTEDHLLVNYAVAVFDEFPYDIFTGVKTKCDALIDSEYKNRFPVGTITGMVGDDSISFTSDVPWLDRYCVIRIEGATDEYHQIDKRDGNVFTFNGMYDGSNLLQDHSGSMVYIHIPVEFGREQKEVIFPAITFWGMQSEVLPIATELDTVLDTFKTDDTFKERQDGRYQDFAILIDCDAHNDEILAVCAEIVRKFLNRQIVWVNGMKITVIQDAPPVEVRSTDSFDIIPKIQYPVSIAIKEEVFDRQTRPKTTTINTPIEIT